MNFTLKLKFYKNTSKHKCQRFYSLTMLIGIEFIFKYKMLNMLLLVLRLHQINKYVL